MIGAPVPDASSPASGLGAGTVNLRLDDYLQEVVQHNDALQAALYEAAASHRKSKAEYGAFEPQFDISATHEANRRTNDLQQAASQSGQTTFDERNDLYEAGVETLLPIGGKVRLGYTLNDLDNNIAPGTGSILGSPNTNNAFYKEYETFVGVSLTQPLLKNAGFAATMAPLRLAAMDSAIAFQQYRRQLMLTISRAESAYWNLYYAQEQMDFFDESVKVSQEVLDDSRQKLQAGQGAELDVMEAQSGLALRQTKRNEALQDYYDALGNLLALTGKSPDPRTGAIANGLALRAADRPPETNADLYYQPGLEDALELNPDYQVLAQKVKQEQLRVQVARNQLLPELDLKSAYGYNGLGNDPGGSMGSMDTQNLPSWSVGLEMIVPLWGGIKEHNMYSAAKLALDEANSTLRDTLSQIANHLSMIIQKTHSWQQSIASYQTVVQFNEALLKTQTERLKAGTIDAHALLEVEADLLDSRQELANALVQYRRAVLEEDLTTGDLLKRHNLEISRQQLRNQTTSLMGE